MIRRLRLSRSGAAAAEFALTVPTLLVIIFGMVQFGMVFWANAGIQNGIGAGARTATLWPARSDAEITAAMRNSMFGIDSAQLSAPVLVRGTSGTQKYVDITVQYQTTWNMILFQIPGIKLKQTRRAYIP